LDSIGSDVTRQTGKLKRTELAGEAKARIRKLEAQHKKAEKAYAAARKAFESGVQDVLERRLDVLHRAGGADRAAYDGGLAERAALDDARRKREAATVAARETLQTYDRVMWRSPEDSVAVRRTNGQVRHMLINGTNVERLTALPEAVRRR
jgi:hypothetical protein